MTHGGAATLCRPVLLYNFVMATKESECGMITFAHLDQLVVLGNSYLSRVGPSSVLQLKGLHCLQMV